MGPLALVSDELREGRLLAPIKEPAIRTRGYFVYETSSEAPAVTAFAAVASQRRQLGGERISHLSLVNPVLS
jgi:hypothetical protein